MASYSILSGSQPISNPLAGTSAAKRPGTAFEVRVTRDMPRSIARLIALPLLWVRRTRHRHELAQLDAGQIRDAGLDAMAVQRESAKPFWLA